MLSAKDEIELINLHLLLLALPELERKKLVQADVVVKPTLSN